MGKETEIGAFEAKNRLSSLIERAARGERIWITKRGRRMALLCSGIRDQPATDGDLVNRFRKLREQAGEGPEPLKALVEEGRR